MVYSTPSHDSVFRQHHQWSTKISLPHNKQDQSCGGAGGEQRQFVSPIDEQYSIESTKPFSKLQWNYGTQFANLLIYFFIWAEWEEQYA